MAMPPQLAQAKRPPRSGKNQRREIIEDLPALDARWLARKKLFRKDWADHRYDLHIDIPIIDWLTLGPYVAQVLFVTGQKQIIPIKWLPIRGACQGVRAIFECVSCGDRRFKLFYYQGRFGCYRCAIASGARYASQQVSRKGRKYLQSQRLRRFLGEYPGCSTIHKPLSMHRKTYSALLNRLRQIEAKPESQRYRSKRLTERILKPVSMYQVEVASIANV
jgi:hypothetical protein